MSKRDEQEGLIRQCPHCGYLQPYILVERLKTRVPCFRCQEFDVQDYIEFSHKRNNDIEGDEWKQI
jgi:hypothetical protein